MSTFFSDKFGVDPSLLEAYGALDVSLVTDLPLFIDPFLLFNSKKPEYRALHDGLIEYLVFLRDKAQAGVAGEPMLRAWYCFPEVKQTWLGYSVKGNQGSGLGIDFARALHENLYRLFPTFGDEQITRGSHLEKVCLIREGVGKDNISDFVTNLIKDFLCSYTQEFATRHLSAELRRTVAVSNAVFSYETETWSSKRYVLPWIDGDYVILCPKDLLTRDENWINKIDLVRRFEEIPAAIPDEQLRWQISNYFQRVLPRYPRKQPSQKEHDDAARRTILEFPQLIDYYIRQKEQKGDEASSIASERVRLTEQLLILQLRELQRLLQNQTAFYSVPGNTYEEAHERVAYLKDVIENKGGYRYFYSEGRAVQRELDLQIAYRLVWYGSPSDVTTEANDGRGPADFKIARGARDKTIVEMKLAKNTQLKRNLKNQAEIYKAASDAEHAIKVILVFSAEEEERVAEILKELGLLDHPDVILIDARRDNKPSGSKA
ncbi:MAG: hypothetical protein ACLQNV_22530 [Steroidobacteraceae bacterium]